MLSAPASARSVLRLARRTTATRSHRRSPCRRRRRRQTRQRELTSPASLRRRSSTRPTPKLRPSALHQSWPLRRRFLPWLLQGLLQTKVRTRQVCTSCVVSSRIKVPVLTAVTTPPSSKSRARKTLSLARGRLRTASGGGSTTTWFLRSTLRGFRLCLVEVCIPTFSLQYNH